jgi:hypothetical protein
MDELVRKLESYLDDSISLENFECWFYDLAYDVEKRWTGLGVDMVHEIEGTLAEASSGNWPNYVLRNELESIVGRYCPRASVWEIRTPRPIRGTSSAAMIGFPVWQLS